MNIILIYQVARVDFSEPQGGKGSCDQKAANIKAHIRRYIDEGHDVQTPEDLYNAITSHDGVQGVRVALVDAISVTAFTNSGKLEGISTLNNFFYSEEGLTCWRAHEIGEGKTEKWSELQGMYTYTGCPRKKYSGLSLNNFKAIEAITLK